MIKKYEQILDKVYHNFVIQYIGRELAGFSTFLLSFNIKANECQIMRKAFRFNTIIYTHSDRLSS